MIREQVMAMTDEELRIKAGWLLGRDIVAEDVEREKTNAVFGGIATVGKRWDPLNDIAAAWELVGAAKEYGWLLTLEVTFIGIQARFSMFALPAHGWQIAPTATASASAVIAPRAITMAYILAMTGGDDDQG